MRFKRQHIIITGGSSGIGLATARLLAQAGATITIIARGQARLESARAEIEALRAGQDQRVLALAADMADQEQAEQAMAQAMTELGPPDVLITAAGVAACQRFLDTSDAEFRRMMDINYFGTLYPIRAVLPAMQQRRSGQIVLVSSGAALLGIYGYTAYSPSKFAVRGLAEALRFELKPLGINVSIVYPPDTDTPQLHEENKTKPIETSMIVHDPLVGAGKVWSADEVARVLLRGIGKRAFVITPGWQMGLLARLHSLIGPALNWYQDRIVRKAQRKGAQRSGTAS